MDRIINVKVGGNHLSKDNKNAGVRGEGNVTNMRITFDEGWDGYAKTVTFYDALGQNPVKRVETVDLIEDITTDHRTYITPIPPEPLAIAGELTFVIDGYKDGKRQRSVSDTLIVKDAPIADNAAEPSEPMPEPYEQIQKQVDGMIGKVQQMYIDSVNSKQNAENAKASEENAEESERIARECAEIAQNSIGKVSYIGDNGNWFAWSDSGFYDTGVKAQAGSTVRSGNNPPDESVPEDCDVYIDLSGDATSEKIKEAVEDYLSEHPIDADVPDWAMQPNKPTYTADEVGAYDKNKIDMEFKGIFSVMGSNAQNIDGMRTDIEGLQKQIREEAHFRGYLSTNAKIQALQATPNDFAYSAESGTKWIYDATEGWQDSGKTVPDQLTSASDTTPLMNGEASKGQEEAYARGDHRHPHDATKVDKTEFESKIGDIEGTLEDHRQDLSKKMEETILYEGVVNTPEWTNQPTYEGTLDSAFKTDDFYYVTLEDASGNALPSGQFMLKSSFEDSATVYSTVFNLAGLNAGTDSTGKSEILIENYPVEFVELGTTIKMRSAGVSMWQKDVQSLADFNINEGVGSVRIAIHGEFVQMTKNGNYYPYFVLTNNVCSYHAEETKSVNFDSSKQIIPYIVQSGTVYGRNRIFDSCELTNDGCGYFSVKRTSIIKYGIAKIFHKTGTAYGNTITDSKTELKAIMVSVSGSNNGVIRNGTHIYVTEVK